MREQEKGERDEDQLAVAPAPTLEAVTGPAAGVVARGGVDEIVALLKTRPAQRDQIFSVLQRERGNAFVRQVIAATTASESPRGGREQDEEDPPAPEPEEKERFARFGSDPQLALLGAGGKTFVVGETGPAVRRLQQSLFDLGYGPLAITGTFDAATEAQVRILQEQSKLPPTGRIDVATYHQIEIRFRDRTIYAGAAQIADPTMHKAGKRTGAVAPAQLMKDTHTLSADEKLEADAALSQDRTQLGAFRRPGPDGNWDTRVEAALRKNIQRSWENHGKNAAKKHENKHALFDPSKIVGIGEISKTMTDGVYGAFATNSAKLVVRDKFPLEAEAIDKLDHDGRIERASNRLQYFTDHSSEIDGINRAHDADPARTEEHGLLTAIKAKLAAEFLDKLMDIDRSWPASAEPGGGIRMQLWKSGDPASNRDRLWNAFGTLIHEYVHTLANPAWRTFRERKSDVDSQAGGTLREGVTELLARAVLSVVPWHDKALHQAVEGEYYDENEPPHERLLVAGGYSADTLRAEEFVGAIGINNLHAAYFLGQTQLAGG